MGKNQFGGQMELSLLEMTLKGGWLMIVLFVLSILAFVIFFERYFKIMKIKKVDDKIFSEVKTLIKKRQFEQAIKLSELNDHHIYKILNKGFEFIKSDKQLAKDAIEQGASGLIRDLEKHTSSLATISSVAPLIGFLGTVTGMIQVFIRLQQAQAGVDIQLLAGGIWEALLTTVGGLVVGIISLLFYNYLIARIEYIAGEVEEKCNEVIMEIKGSDYEA